MTAWLDSLDFLTPSQREDLKRQDLDAPEAVRMLTAPQLAGLGLDLTIGKAARLLAAAQVSGPAQATATNVSVQIAEPPDHATRVQRALEAAAADPSKLGALVDLLDHVVVGTEADPESDAINVAATRAMLAHLATGALVGSTWSGLRVVSVREVVAPRIYCNPRTGKALQAGKDEVSLVPWAELGIEGLRLAAYGYERGLFEGRSEDAVFASVRDDKALRQRIAVMAKAAGVELALLDGRLIWTRQVKPAPLGPIRELPPRQVRDGSPRLNPWAMLSGLLGEVFSADELRRFIRETCGRQVADMLPGPMTSLASLAAETATLLQRQGLVTADLRAALYASRPRRADDIDRVFAALGVA